MAVFLGCCFWDLFYQSDLISIVHAFLMTSPLVDKILLLRYLKGSRTNFNVWLFNVRTLVHLDCNTWTIIIMMLCSQYGFPWLSLAFRPYYPSLPPGPLESILCLYRALVGKFLLVGQHVLVRMKGFHWRTLLTISSLLLQQCPACLVCLTLMVLEMRGGGCTSTLVI